MTRVIKLASILFSFHSCLENILFLGYVKKTKTVSDRPSVHI